MKLTYVVVLCVCPPWLLGVFSFVWVFVVLLPHAYTYIVTKPFVIMYMERERERGALHSTKHLET